MQRKIGWIWGVSLLVWSVATAYHAQAQETAPPATAQAEAPAKPSPWSPVEAAGLDGPLKSWGLEIHSLLAANYTYNFNEPRSGKNGLLLMNRKHDHFDLDLANIRIQRVVDGEIGFVTDLNFGKTAEVVGRATRWCKAPPSISGKGSCHESRNSFEATQFYLTYKFPVGNGLSMKLGKFVTLHGAEVIKTWDNINYNISNSILFGWAIPFTHSGVLFNYALTDWISLDAGLITGWDQFSYKVNNGVVFTGGLTVTPLPTLTFYAAGTVGPEQERIFTDPITGRFIDAKGRGDSKRGLFTLLTTYKPTDQWTFILDFNHADESDVLPPIKPSGRGTEDARWDGLAGYVIYHFTDELSASLRAEFFDDVDGVRTGLKQTVWEITPTLTYQVWPGLTLRAEYRHDESSKRFFEGPATFLGTRFFPGQDTVAWEMLYSF
ncbi:MAG TPA: outer membrane beta-barrel protein [Candidatus Binatia bacterium]|nr:outer membrane beta-barrel protein [Candidatus Binatia bacterium]